MLNKIEGTLNDTERDRILEGVDTLEASLPFGTMALNPQEVTRIAKAGPATASFVTDGLELASRNADLLPASVTPQQLQERLALIRNLDVVVSKVAQFQERLVNTSTVAKAEAYELARTSYALLKRKKAAGMRDGRDRLAQRFVKQGRRKSNTKVPVEQV